MPAPFSRLQLAAALIEYDNDPENVEGKNKSAQESAIFAHFRRNPAARPDLHNRRTDHLGVNLPTDTGTLDGRGSAIGTRRSRGSRNSLDALRNPFGIDEEEQEEQAGEDLEVDLSSWGLDQFIPKEKTKAKGKQKQSPAPTLAVVRSKTVLGGPNDYGEIPAAMAQSKSYNSLNLRRQSISSRLEMMDETATQHTLQRRRAASQSNILPTDVQDGGSIPFPSGRQSPGYDQIGGPRSQSRASIGSRGLLDEFQEGDDQGRYRRMSQGTLGTDNPFAIQAPTVTSRFDPKAAPVHERTISHGSLGSRGLLDNFDAASMRSHDSLPRDRPYSVVELLRPKVLVMPSPLQAVEGALSEDTKPRDGFQLSKDGPPLPPGARPLSRRLSSNLDNIPIPSNSFIPNPTADLSYAQKVFRNTLAIGSATGLVTDKMPPRATEDGEQIDFEPAPVPQPLAEDEDAFYGSGQGKPTRPAGKLYGKSLIDDLEMRKQQMRNKQRVFRGDQRPSMMARGESATTVSTGNRTSTLIDPETLKIRPVGTRQSSYGSQGLARHNSLGSKPLLNFDDDSKVQNLSPARPLNATRNKSVFGVDTLWEAEMVKLREIQEQERLDQEERRKMEEEESKRNAEKDKKKLRKKKKGQLDTPPAEVQEGRLGVQESTEPRLSIEPPVLPDIKPAIRRTMPPPQDDDSDEEDSDDDGVAPPRAEVSGAWHSDSEDEGPRRTTGVGLRDPIQTKFMQHRRGGSDSEEDLPLNLAMQRATIRNTRMPGGDSDEDMPLAQVVREPKIKSPLDIDFDNLGARPLGGGDDSDDEQPLGLRASCAMLVPSGGDDGDKPLAFHPEQQRRTQYQMFAVAQQQQQQQQAMMMQAQMAATNSMFFNPQAMMSAPFFAPTPMMSPLGNPMAMMQPPMPIPSPPPIHDEAKFMSVDRWRRDVAIDGDR